MANVSEDIQAEGVQIIWVLQQSSVGQGGTAEGCLDFFTGEGASTGICVGDAEVFEQRDAFQDSPFASGRGFDMLVRRSDMNIVFTTSHGSGGGNDNISGNELLDIIRSTDR